MLLSFTRLTGQRFEAEDCFSVKQQISIFLYLSLMTMFVTLPLITHVTTVLLVVMISLAGGTHTTQDVDFGVWKKTCLELGLCQTQYFSAKPVISEHHHTFDSWRHLKRKVEPCLRFIKLFQPVRINHQHLL